jgi:hypothetical protein
MNASHRKAVGWVLIFVGVVLGMLSPDIVCLIARAKHVVGPDGVVYVVDPPRMMYKVFSVILVGFLLCVRGFWLIKRRP